MRYTSTATNPATTIRHGVKLLLLMVMPSRSPEVVDKYFNATRLLMEHYPHAHITMPLRGDQDASLVAQAARGDFARVSTTGELEPKRVYVLSLLL